MFVSQHGRPPRRLSENTKPINFVFFLYYVTLLITPMILLSGVFFPLSSLPEEVCLVSAVLPLQPVIILVRGLMHGRVTLADGLHLLVPIFFS